MQNFGVTDKEHHGMLWYFLEWSIMAIVCNFNCISAVKEDLKEISIWCCRNSLLINPDKTKLLYVGVPQLMRTLPTPLPSATMLGTQIKPVTVAKDLGVYIDCHLNFNEHITKTASDCMFKLTRVNRIKHLIDKKNIDLSYKCFRLQQIILLFDGMELHEQEER